MPWTFLFGDMRFSAGGYIPVGSFMDQIICNYSLFDHKKAVFPLEQP